MAEEKRKDIPPIKVNVNDASKMEVISEGKKVKDIEITKKESVKKIEEVKKIAN